MRELLKLIRLAFVSLTLLFSSCGSYIQRFETNSPLPAQESYFVHEDRKVKVVYDFYYEKGLMEFVLINQGDRPIYIDWSRSGLVYNGMKNNYWSDITVANTVTFGHTVHYLPPNPKFMLSGSASASQTVITKPERITFIPPQSSILFRKYNLFFDDCYLFSPSSTVEQKPCEIGMVKMRIERFSETSSPISFRNFISYSFSESGEDMAYVDDMFYVSEIRHYPASKNHLFKKGSNEFFVRTTLANPLQGQKKAGDDLYR